MTTRLRNCKQCGCHLFTNRNRYRHLNYCYDCYMKITRERYHSNPEPKRAVNREYNQKHKKIIQERASRWNREHPERVREIQRSYYKRIKQRELEELSNDTVRYRDGTVS